MLLWRLSNLFIKCLVQLVWYLVISPCSTAPCFAVKSVRANFQSGFSGSVHSLQRFIILVQQDFPLCWTNDFSVCVNLQVHQVVSVSSLPG